MRYLFRQLSSLPLSFQMMIDAACDTKAINQALDRVHNKRVELMTSYENEDKEVKRKLKADKEETRARLRAELEQRREAEEGQAGEVMQDDVTEAQVCVGVRACEVVVVGG